MTKMSILKVKLYLNNKDGVTLLKMSFSNLLLLHAAERVFSVLNNTFASKQLRALEDYVEASIMLQYNKGNRQSVLNSLVFVKCCSLPVNIVLSSSNCHDALRITRIIGPFNKNNRAII